MFRPGHGPGLRCSPIPCFVLDRLERKHGEAFVVRVMSCLACGRHRMTGSERPALGQAEGGHPPIREDEPMRWGR